VLRGFVAVRELVQWCFLREECGREAICFTFDVKSLDNLNAGALRQFTIGRMD